MGKYYLPKFCIRIFQFGYRFRNHVFNIRSLNWIQIGRGPPADSVLLPSLIKRFISSSLIGNPSTLLNNSMHDPLSVFHISLLKKYLHDLPLLSNFISQRLKLKLVYFWHFDPCYTTFIVQHRLTTNIQHLERCLPRVVYVAIARKLLRSRPAVAAKPGDWMKSVTCTM